MLLCKMKRGLAFILCLCVMLSVFPITALAQEKNIGSIEVTTTKDPPAPVEGAVWVLIDSNECKQIVHNHEDNCYYKSCDHKDGHLSTCYGETTAYALCEHDDDTQHTGSVTLADVVTINGTNVSWKTGHPAYSVVRAIYQTAYDEAYNSAKYLKDTVAKAAGVAALVGKSFCYTTSATATPDNCTHGECSVVGGSCYSKLCILGEHQHNNDCFKYTWELKADINKNGVADDVDTYYTVKYVSDNEVIFEQSVLVNMPTPIIENPSKIADAQYTYQFIGWDTVVADIVTEDVTYTALYNNVVNKYNVVWKNEDGSILEMDTDVEYGLIPSYDGNEPTKQGDNSITYTFAGWTPSVDTVKGDVIYTATYTNKSVFPVEFYIDGQYVKTEYVVDGETVAKYSPTKSHYELTEWHDNNGKYDFNTPVVGSVRLDSNWVMIENVVDIISPNASHNLTNTVYSIGETINFTVTPNDGYVVETVLANGKEIEVSYNDGSAIVNYTANIVDGVDIVFTLITKRAELIVNEAEMNAFGNLNSEAIFNAIYNAENSNPSNLKYGDVTIEYLAYSIELLGKTYDWWVTPETNVSMQKFLDQYGLGSLANYIPADIVPHNFGTQGVEMVRLTYGGTEKYPAMSAETTVTLVDKRIPTQICLNKSISVTYGATAEDILSLVFGMVTADETLVTNDLADVTIRMDSLNAGQRTATVIYNGNNIYGASSASVDVYIKKAQSYVNVNSTVNKFGATIDVSQLINSNANRVEVVAGLKLGNNASVDAGSVIYVNLPKFIDADAIENVTLKAIVEKINDGIEKLGNKTMTIAELQETLEEILPYVETMEEYGYETNLTTETISGLSAILNQIKDIEGLNSVSIKVSIGKNIVLSDAGIYLVAGVTSDTNYVTSFDANYVAITPDGYKAELDWKISDANGIVTIDALRSGYDLGAYVSKTYEGNVQDAMSRLYTLFVGVDVDGNFIVTQNQNELTYGAYSEIAFIADLGNTMYYAKPIVRSFIVTKNLVNVYFVDENGNINHDRIFGYGQDATMTAYPFDRNTNELISGGTMSYAYFGLQTNGEFYYGNTVPTKPGAYTVIATFVGDGETEIGATMGTFIIEQSDTDFDMQDVTVDYDGNNHFVVVTDTIGLQHIFVVIDKDNNVNIMLPQNWGIGSFDALGTIDEIVAMLETLNLPSTLAPYRTDLLNTINEVLTSLDEEYDINSVIINGTSPADVGTYVVIGVAFGNPDYKIAIDSAELEIVQVNEPSNPDDDKTEDDNDNKDDVDNKDDNTGDNNQDDNQDDNTNDDNNTEDDKNNNEDNENNENDKEDGDSNKDDVVTPPQTGDNSNVGFWFMLMLVSGLFMALLIKKKR